MTFEEPAPGAPVDDEAVVSTDLSRRFAGITAVDQLTFSVTRGQIFGLVGPDGAGKTTTMRILCGVMLPTSGTARVAGFDLLQQSAEVRKRTGYLSQRFSLYGDLTVWENIAFCADLYRVPRRRWHERAEELLRASRMTEFKDRLADNLSGGMRQKLALSCALIHTPEVVFLDEPTTGVDPVSRREFWTILYRLPAQGVTLIVSTPYMDEAERCMRLAFVREGRLLDCGTPQQFKARLAGQVLALTALPQRPARDLLRRHPRVRQAVLFGEAVHVLVQDAESDLPALRQALEQADIEVRDAHPIQPGLEDVFVSLASVSGE